MKLNHILYPAMFGCLFSLYSCVEDKGSYDHLPVNEITVTGTEKTYSVLAGITELTIEPTITGSILGEDDSQYEYTWYACKKELGHLIWDDMIEIYEDMKDVDVIVFTYGISLLKQYICIELT